MHLVVEHFTVNYVVYLTTWCWQSRSQRPFRWKRHLWQSGAIKVVSSRFEYIAKVVAFSIASLQEAKVNSYCYCSCCGCWYFTVECRNKWMKHTFTACEITATQCAVVVQNSFEGKYTLWVKKQYTWRLIITSANVDRFSKFFHWQIPNELLHILITGSSTSP